MFSQINIRLRGFPIKISIRIWKRLQHTTLSFAYAWEMKTCIKRWKGAFRVLLADLSKVFDSLSHEFLLAKLYAYGFSFVALRFVHTYLTNRKQTNKINSSYSYWKEVLLGVPQGSILEPLFFNIFFVTCS